MPESAVHRRSPRLQNSADNNDRIKPSFADILHESPRDKIHIGMVIKGPRPFKVRRCRGRVEEDAWRNSLRPTSAGRRRWRNRSRESLPSAWIRPLPGAARSLLGSLRDFIGLRRGARPEQILRSADLNAGPRNRRLCSFETRQQRLDLTLRVSDQLARLLKEGIGRLFVRHRAFETRTAAQSIE